MLHSQQFDEGKVEHNTVTVQMCHLQGIWLQENTFGRSSNPLVIQWMMVNARQEPCQRIARLRTSLAPCYCHLAHEYVQRSIFKFEPRLELTEGLILAVDTQLWLVQIKQ